MVKQEIIKKNEQRAILESLSSTKQLLDVPIDDSILVNTVTITHPVTRSVNMKMSTRRWNSLLTNPNGDLYNKEVENSYNPKHFDSMKKASCLPANAWTKQQSSNTLLVMQHRNNLPSLFFWKT